MKADDIAHVTALVKTAGTSFFYGMKILPAPRRDAMYGIYAFCRVVDDIADEEAPIETKHRELDAWRARIGMLYAGLAQDAITRVLRTAIKEYNLPREDFLSVIDGMEMDAGSPMIAPPLASLDQYCDHVASSVGRLSVRVFGDDSNAAQDLAYSLGRALQLTNILRDVGEDAARGRLYLPFEYLREANIEISPEAALASPALPEVCARVADMAERYFREADSTMELCDQTAMRPAKLMAASYRPLLELLREQNFNYSHGRPSLPKWRKLLLAASAFLP